MEDIAIVGMACLFPGAPDIKKYWQNIINKVDAVSDPPEDWAGDFSFDPHSKDNNKIYCKRGGYLGDLSTFDPIKYGIMPMAVDGAEPEHFLALRVVEEALKDAGFPDIPINNERTAVILGRGTYVNRALMNLHQHGFVIHQTLNIIRELHPEYTDKVINKLRQKLKEKLPPFDAVIAPGVVSSIMTGRISNRLDLKGNNFIIDAACASSLLAVEYGIQDLRSGKCDVVIAGGVNLSANNLLLMVFSRLGVLSRNSQIRPFDKNADGTLLGEGVGAVILKRLTDAERDGNRIYALIKSVSSASDGRAKSVIAPTVEGEESTIRRAYESSGISPDSVQLIEAHGTAMPLGDITEIRALSRVFGLNRDGLQRCAIGTVKSMIGHLIPASGIAGLIKVVLAIYHKTLPPTLHCDTPNPELELEKTPFYINTETRPWIHGLKTPRRAGVNAFGFGGINAHAIVEEYTKGDTLNDSTYHRTWETELCIFMAKSRYDLIKRCDEIFNFLSAMHDVPLRDLAYTLNSDISNGPYRLSIVASSIEEMKKKLSFCITKLKEPACMRINDRNGMYFSEKPLVYQGKLAFLFPGEGSQYINMLADLCIHFPEVRYCFDLTDRGFLKEKNSHTLSDLIFPPPSVNANKVTESEKLIWQMESGVQAVTTANRALFKLLRKLEITPDAVVGHSSGEFSALEAAGAIMLDTDEDVAQYVFDGIKSVKGVASYTKNISSSVLIALNVDDRSLVLKLIEESRGNITVAMDNCPHQIIICVNDSAAEKTIKNLHALGISCTSLPFKRAYHTKAFDAACGPLRNFFKELKIVRPNFPIYSCASASLFPEKPEEIRKLAVAQWTLPVLFRETIEMMYKDGFRIFVEVGPRSNLVAFVNDTLKGRPYLAVPINVQQRSGITQLNHALGMLSAQGVNMNLNYLYLRREPHLLNFRHYSVTSFDINRHKDIPKLTMSLPMINLDQKDLKEIKSHLMKAEDEGMPEKHKDRVALNQFIETLEQGQLLEINNTIQKASVSDTVMSRTQVMNNFFLTQQRFLESQEHILKAYLNKKLNIPLNTIEKKEKSIQFSESIEDNKTFKPIQKLPFIRAIITECPCKEIVIRCDLDLHEDIFLKHHVLGGKVSMFDEGLTALPAMPFAMSMEMVAETASLLFENKILTTLKNIRANRWITIENERLGLEINARCVAENEVYVTVREIESGKRPVTTPIFEATAFFSDVYPEPPEADEFTLHASQKSRFTKGNLYKTGMFNGPSFQAIDSIEQYGENWSIATLQALPNNSLFKSIPDPKFIIDPILLDAVGQQAAHWNAERSSSGFNFFPYFVKELRLYRPNLVYPLKAESRLRIKPIDESRFVSDIDVIGPDGKMLFQVIGWEDKSFNLPEIFYGIRHGIPDSVLGTSWPTPLSMLPNPDLYECRRLDGFSDELMLGHGKIWLKVLSRQILSRRERTFWHNLNYSDSRRKEWLLGRAAAKDVVRILLNRRYGIEICFADIEIETDDNRAPIINGIWTDKVEYIPSISIAHTKNIAVAFATDGSESIRVGIDLEHIRTLQDGFIGTVFSPEEITQLSAIPSFNTAEWVLRLWCAKEAVAKAIGIGFGGKPKRFIIQELNLHKGIVKIGFSEDLTFIRPNLKGLYLFAYTFREDDLIISTAIYPRS